MAADLPKGDFADPPVTGSAKARPGAGNSATWSSFNLRQHSYQDFTPSALGKVMVRSSDTIANACEKLA